MNNIIKILRLYFFFNIKTYLVIVLIVGCFKAFSQNDTVKYFSKDTISEFCGKRINNVLIIEDDTFKGDFSFGISYFRNDIIYSQITSNKDITRSQIEANEYYRNAKKINKADLFMYSNALQTTVSFANMVSTSENEGAVAVHPNGREMFFTRSYIKFGNLNFEICYAIFESGEWKESNVFNLKSNSYSYAYPNYSKDGNSLYFASDMKNGTGGFDLYYITKGVDSTWSNPQSLGSNINSPSDEIYPYMYNDSILMFSSNGYQGHGGFDLYYVNLNDENPTPINMQAPFNSEYDDITILFQPNSDYSGYLVSNRESSKKIDRLFSFIIDYKDTIIEPDSMLIISQNIILDNSFEELLNIQTKKFADKLLLDYDLVPKVNIENYDDSNKKLGIKVETPEKYKNEVYAAIEDFLDYFRKHPDMKIADMGTDFMIKSNRPTGKNVDVAVTVDSEDDISSVVQAIISEYLSSNTKPKGDSIEVTIEILDPKDKSGGKKKQTYTLSLPSDVGGYDVEVAVGRRTVSLNEPVVYGSNYSVLIDTYSNYQDITMFDKIKELRIYPGVDNNVRYTSGTAKTMLEAQIILNDVKRNGFVNSEIVTVREMENLAVKNIYGIQLFASKKRKNKNEFRNIDFVDEYYNEFDKLYRYGFGRYYNKQDAQKHLDRIRNMGFKNAFITDFSKNSYIQNFGR
jgi:hypothetical protein